MVISIRTKDNGRRKMRKLAGFFISIGAMNTIVAGIVALGRLYEKGGSRFYGLKPMAELAGWEAVIKMMLALLIVAGFGWIMRRETQQRVLYLFRLWAFIFIAVQAFYYASKIVYEQTLIQLMNVTTGAQYTDFYTQTHGFKYAAMFLGIMIGVYMTGIMLHSRLLPVVSVLLGVVFLACSGFADMMSIPLGNGKEVGVVLSGAMFHAIQTAGILFLGLYTLYLEWREEKKQGTAAVLTEEALG